MTRGSADADVVVVGSGVAGLTTALGLARTRRVVLLTSGDLGSGSTRWAQGGLAASLAPDDSPGRHARDTATAGADLCVPRAVDRLVEEGPLRVAELVACGAVLDRDAAGRLALGREGGHTRRRVVHAGGDATGAEVSRALVAAVRGSRVEVMDRATIDQVLLAPGASGPVAAGVRVLVRGEPLEVTARAVVLATGGIGGLFTRTTNPAEVGGEGLGIALRAGATLTDLEFVQFHPTALRITTAGSQLPLVTEALRGEGAVLVDGTGRRLLLGHHPLADLAPRDVVARRLHEVMTAHAGSPAGDVFLDATALGAERLRAHFPTVYAACSSAGIDPAVDPIPVAPAQHFSCGGVRTDRWGATDVPGLFAVGEVAATGVHGANRLASNSLLEGLVYGSRVAARLVLELPDAPVAGRIDVAEVPEVRGGTAAVATVVSRAAGIVRGESGLASGEAELGALAATTGRGNDGNRWLAARALLAAARHRRESRGCHWRDDFPAAFSAWQRHVPVRLEPGRGIVVDEQERRLLSA